MTSSSGLHTIFDAFYASYQRYPNRPLFHVLDETADIYGIEAGEQSYAQCHRAVMKQVALLEQAGYGKGHRVMLLLENRPDYFIWLLALNHIGASCVPVNPDLRHAELCYMIGHSEPSLIVTIPSRRMDLIQATLETKIKVKIINHGDKIPSTLSKDIKTSAHQEAALLYTSGTTGNPKGCILTNSYFLEAGRWYAEAGGLCALYNVVGNGGERMITPLPVFHMNAMAYSFMAMVTMGGCLIVLDRFHPSSWWQAVQESRATCLHYLGVMPSLLMAAEASFNDKNHAIRFGFGAGVDPKIHEAFETRFDFPLIEAWAMTETGAGAVICANQEPREIGTSCLGKPASEIEMALLADDGTKSLYGVGELLVRRSKANNQAEQRYGFFAGYYKDETATDKAWENDWFHTGDIVRRAEDGSVYFVDRKKNVIRRSGENIAAIEVESTLMRHPAIRAVAVTAVPDEIRGDEVFACIVSDNHTQEIASDIVAWCLTQLAYYKAPGYIAFIDTLPLTGTQKIQRGELKKLAEGLMQKAYDMRMMKKRDKK